MHVAFREGNRLDAAFIQFGEIAEPNQSDHIYLVATRPGRGINRVFCRSGRSRVQPESNPSSTQVQPKSNPSPTLGADSPDGVNCATFHVHLRHNEELTFGIQVAQNRCSSWLPYWSEGPPGCVASMSFPICISAEITRCRANRASAASDCAPAPMQLRSSLTASRRNSRSKGRANWS